MFTGMWSIPGTTAMIALALGYIVFTLANKEKGRLKTTGYIIGVAIIIISIFLILVKFFLIATGASNNDRFLMRHRMMMQQQQPLQEMPAPAPKK